MFTHTQYHAKAVEYGEMVKTSASPNQKRELQRLEDSFTVLADNEQWLEDNHSKTVHVPKSDASGDILATEEEDILRCFGGRVDHAVEYLTDKVGRELFDNAGSMGELLKTEELRGQIARFCAGTSE